MLETLFPELSPRQIHILRMVAHGLDNQYIANYLDINQRTVEYHVQRLLKLLVARGPNYDKRARLAHLFYERILDATMDTLENY